MTTDGRTRRLELDRLYVGRRDADGSGVVAYQDPGGEWCQLVADTRAGFDWGHESAGAAALTRILCADIAPARPIGDAEMTRRMESLLELVAALPTDRWQLTRRQIRSYVGARP